VTAAQACRIETLRVDHRGHVRPFTLTTTCGWTGDVAQGTAWPQHPTRALWLDHACTLRAAS
jgi:hypothetical protein